ncbi:predicted protein [Naegleria gruberi]|uniref:Predicted protein n=1 Tax=Naegleria gruberi TaxID=5762 RepID=D2W054_NAEGR|nr:uncharacterized protein NAEGRDRAFT_53656 [Naegleria gruberi]EFC37555.1 predicted protein [Naegleria gruberi]|eukprot:XP_002670299.1 predicted protein [Naegleria gruberi strain NEG-M]
MLLALGAIVVGGLVVVSKYYLRLFDWLDFSFIFKQKNIIEKFPNDTFKTKSDVTNLEMTLFWYPVALSKDVSITDSKPKTIKLFGEPLALYRTSDGNITCVKDLCPHRSAKLSTGQVTEFEGKRSLECAYHGWRFEKEGQCVRIPSVSSERMKGLCSTIKCQAKQVHECCGLIWVFPNDKVKADINQIPLELFREEFLTDDSSKLEVLIENTRDLPCHYSFVLENLLDPAHLDFTHDGTIGKRSQATQIQSQLVISKDIPSDNPSRRLIPKEMQYDQSIHQDSFTYRFTKPEFKKIPGLKSEFMVQLSFIPPCFVRMDTTDYIANERSGPRMSQVFCLIPTGEGEVKVIFKFYSSLSILNFLNKIPFIRNKFAKTVDMIFDQDLELLAGVYENVNNGVKVFSKIVNADAPIKGYREWEAKMLNVNKKGIFFKGWENVDIEDLF